jgi:hypothetical protein
LAVKVILAPDSVPDWKAGSKPGVVPSWVVGPDLVVKVVSAPDSAAVLN